MDNKSNGMPSGSLGASSESSSTSSAPESVQGAPMPKPLGTVLTHSYNGSDIRTPEGSSDHKVEKRGND